MQPGCKGSRYYCIERVTNLTWGPQEGRNEVCRCPEVLFKIADMKYSCVDVEQLSPICTNQFLVKETDTCIVVSQFNLDRTVSWRGEQFGTVTGTWLHYLSTPMICPCACAAMQQIGMDTDKIDNVHPIYHIWHHSLWKEVINRNTTMGADMRPP